MNCGLPVRKELNGFKPGFLREILCLAGARASISATGGGRRPSSPA